MINTNLPVVLSYLTSNLIPREVISDTEVEIEDINSGEPVATVTYVLRYSEYPFVLISVISIPAPSEITPSFTRK